MIAVDAAREAVVVRAENGDGPGRALSRRRDGAREVEALEIPSFLRGRRARLEVLQRLAFVGIDRVEVRVRTRRDAAVETAHLRRPARLEFAGDAPSGPGAATGDRSL